MRQRQRADRDFYRTPKECVLLADKLMDSSLSWWECCAGDGAISSNLDKITYASDIYPMVDGIEKLNVLTCDKPKDVDVIRMLADILYTLNRLPEAIDNYKRLINLGQHDIKFYKNMDIKYYTILIHKLSTIKEKV